MFIKLLFQSLVVFLTIDAVWITQVASPWMKKAVPHLMADKANLLAAFVFYVLYLAILLVLIVMPELSNKNWQPVVQKAFLFGFAAYATYDLTNLAVMKNFPWNMAVVDMFWGGLLTAITALIIWKINT